MSIIWIRWYKLYADGMTPKRDNQYDYQWYNKGNRTANEMYSVIEMDLEEQINFYEEGEHYRCFRWEIIDKPPQWYVDRLIEHHTAMISHSTSMIEWLKSY